MNIALLGFDIEGQASYDYYTRAGHTVTICDQNNQINIPDGALHRLGQDYLDDLDGFDLLIRTPGLHPRLITNNRPHLQQKIWTGTNEFFTVCPTKNIIGVTGTKGKGTTSTLIANILTAAGKTVHLGGNIGRAMLGMLPEIQENDWVVLELSNFQLIDVQSSPHIAVCLMVAPEHLNWHHDVNEYYTAKKQLFNKQTSADWAVYNADNPITMDIINGSAAQKIPYFVPYPPFNRPKTKDGAYLENDTIYFKGFEVCRLSDIGLRGRHNVENICAAIAATWSLVDGNAILLRQVISDYNGLEHRLERVEEIDGVEYYNDSFATTPETAIAAIRSFEQPKVLIVGGSDKGVSLDPLIQEILSSNVRHVISIGVMGSYIASELLKSHFNHITTGLSTMEDVVQTARDVAQKGDVVLLSTGCASFDMFKDYKDRGNQFKQSVYNL